jgi:hypothetical protein
MANRKGTVFGFGLAPRELRERFGVPPSQANAQQDLQIRFSI